MKISYEVSIYYSVNDWGRVRTIVQPLRGTFDDCRSFRLYRQPIPEDRLHGQVIQYFPKVLHITVQNNWFVRDVCPSWQADQPLSSRAGIKYSTTNLWIDEHLSISTWTGRTHSPGSVVRSCFQASQHFLYSALHFQIRLKISHPSSTCPTSFQMPIR